MGWIEEYFDKFPDMDNTVKEFPKAKFHGIYFSRTTRSTVY